MKPFKKPAAEPAKSPIATNPKVFTPAWEAMPIKTEDKAIIEATEMSISPHMITNIMGRAIIAFSIKLKVVFIRLV